MTFCATFT